jgi:SAM-dependent methyltransferase
VKQQGGLKMARPVMDRIYKLAQKARPYIPFTALNTAWRSMNKECQSILDVGCGTGEPMKFVSTQKHCFTVGIDIFEPYLKECKRQRIHGDYVLCDVCNLPFKDNSFDIVLCLEVLEHIEREQGEKLLKEMERIAKRQVVLSTPVGKYKQEAYDENPHQEHKYIWSPKEMKALGYKVIGIGVRNLCGKAGIQSPLPTPLRLLINIIWVLAGPFVYFLPRLAGDMVCTKYLTE